MNTQIAMLQEQVDTLFASMNALRNGEPSATGSMGEYAKPEFRRSMSNSVSQGSAQSPSKRYRTHPLANKHLNYRGPTSSAFSFDVAKSSLQSMGIQSIVDDPEEGPGSPPAEHMDLHPSKDPLWSLTREEVLRLITLYEDEMGLMYPVAVRISLPVLRCRKLT
jgi:hypothetical protein